MRSIGLDTQRRIMYIPVINAVIIFMFLHNVLYYGGLSAKLQFKAFLGMLAGSLIAFVLFKLTGIIPNGKVLGLVVSYVCLLFVDWWLIRIQKEMGAHK